MIKSRLFTVVLDYKGGTYISQVSATSPTGALTKWLSDLKDADMSEWGITRNALAKIVKAERIVSLDDCFNVWCISGSGRHGLALVNIIATDESR